MTSSGPQAIVNPVLDHMKFSEAGFDQFMCGIGDHHRSLIAEGQPQLLEPTSHPTVYENGEPYGTKTTADILEQQTTVTHRDQGTDDLGHCVGDPGGDKDGLSLMLLKITKRTKTWWLQC